jgi:hypothetical protein
MRLRRIKPEATLQIADAQTFELAGHSRRPNFNEAPEAR